MKRITIAISALVLSACGGGDGGSSEKDLFSLWNETTTNNPLDLRGGSFSASIPMAFYFVGGEQCNCTMRVLGSQGSGSYAINSCYYVYGSGSSDPGCNSLNDTGTYTKSSDTLTVTPSSGSAVTYK